MGCFLLSQNHGQGPKLSLKLLMASTSPESFLEASTAELPRIKLRTELSWSQEGSSACGEVHIIEGCLSFNFSVVMEDVSLSPKLSKGVSSLCGTGKHRRETSSPHRSICSKMDIGRRTGAMEPLSTATGPSDVRPNTDKGWWCFLLPKPTIQLPAGAEVGILHGGRGRGETELNATPRHTQTHTFTFITYMELTHELGTPTSNGPKES